MASNVQKIPLARSLNQFAERKVLDYVQLTGKALPARVEAVSGSIVTVSFQVQTGGITLPIVTMPMFGPEYIRYPTQIGDQGVVFPADVPLGCVSGLGGGIPTLLSLPGNLSALVWFPIASKAWSATDDPGKLVLYGPDGAVLRNTANTSGVTVSNTGTAIKGLPLVSPPPGFGNLWNSSGTVMIVP